MIYEAMLLGHLFDEDDVEPIDFLCKECQHSYEDHEKGHCNHGIFSKYECKKFVLDKDQVKETKEELETLAKLMFKNFETAKELDEGNKID